MRVYMKILSSILLFSLFPACGCSASGQTGSPAFIFFKAEAGVFSCYVPSAWAQARDLRKDKSSGVVKLSLTGDSGERIPAMIYITHFGKTNRYFKDPAAYIKMNSTDALDMPSKTDKYGPVSETVLAGKKAFVFEREKKEYLEPEGKSEESVVVRERFIVVPAREGFYALHYYCPQKAFKKHLPYFDRVVKTLKLKY